VKGQVIPNSVWMELRDDEVKFNETEFEQMFGNKKVEIKAPAPALGAAGKGSSSYWSVSNKGKMTLVLQAVKEAPTIC